MSFDIFPFSNHKTSFYIKHQHKYVRDRIHLLHESWQALSRQTSCTANPLFHGADHTCLLLTDKTITLTMQWKKFQLEFWIFGKWLFSDSWHSTTTFCHNKESQQHKAHRSTSPTNNRHRCGHHVSDRYHKCHKQSGPHNCMYHWSQCSYIKNIVAILYSFK
jgi:hypothetical protein